MIRPIRIIAGAQTGADIGALRAAAALGLPTGGYCPLGCQTETGAQPWLIPRYGLRETPTRAYALRTLMNLGWADITVLFGEMATPGSRLALRELTHSQKLYLVNPTPAQLRNLVATVHPQVATREPVDNDDRDDRVIPRVEPGVVLNVAGNRGSTAPALEAFVFAVIVAAFWDPAGGAGQPTTRPATPVVALPTLTDVDGRPWVHPEGLTAEAYVAQLDARVAAGAGR